MTLSRAKTTQQLARLRDLALIREKAKLARMQKVSEQLERQRRDLIEAAEILDGVKFNGSAKIREIIGAQNDTPCEYSSGSFHRVRTVLAEVDDISERLGGLIDQKTINKTKTEELLLQVSREHNQAFKRVYKLKSAVEWRLGVDLYYSTSDEH